MSLSVETRIVEPDEDGMRVDRWFKAHYPDWSWKYNINDILQQIYTATSSKN